jgi:hypothetical protein
MFFIGFSTSTIPYLIIGLCSVIWFFSGKPTESTVVQNHQYTVENVVYTDCKQSVESEKCINAEVLFDDIKWPITKKKPLYGKGTFTLQTYLVNFSHRGPPYC